MCRADMAANRRGRLDDSGSNSAGAGFGLVLVGGLGVAALVAPAAVIAGVWAVAGAGVVLAGAVWLVRAVREYRTDRAEHRAVLASLAARGITVTEPPRRVRATVVGFRVLHGERPSVPAGDGGAR